MGKEFNVTREMLTSSGRDPEQGAAGIPRGYVLKKAPRTARLVCLVMPDLKEAIEQEAHRQKISQNELVNTILEAHFFGQKRP